MTNQLIFPMALYVFYILGFAVFMFRSRVRNIRAGEISPRYFKVYEGQKLPERAELIAQHFQNQFEMPILFLITCVVFISLDAVNAITVTIAWTFVISRGLHAWIHLGRNRVPRRAAAFGMGVFCVLG